MTSCSWSMVKKFWPKVDVHGVDDCWEWQGRRIKTGYGHFWPGYRAGGERYRRNSIIAHRFAYQSVKGAIPLGLYVIHSCDNPACCNPNHLRLGTQTDNMQDMVSKGRAHSPKGMKNGRAKLTDLSVLDIRERHIRGESGVSIARVYGVTPTTISEVVARKIWRHV